MKKYLAFGLATLFCVLGSSQTAHASGVIIDMRDAGQLLHAASRYDLSDTAMYTKEESQQDSGQSSSLDESAPLELRKKGPPLLLGPAVPNGPIGPIEYRQIQSGLITEEEAMSGCGGASAATGPASLLPLLVAGGALLRRRRARTLPAEG